MRHIKKYNIFKQVFFASFISIFLSTVFVISSIFLSGKIDEQNYDKSLLRLESNAQKLSLRIEQILSGYGEILFSTRGVIKINQDIDQKDWDSFWNTQNFSDRYPAVQSVGFVQFVKDENKEEYVRSVRDSLGKDSEFTIHPEGKRDEYYVARYSRDFDDSREFPVGFDLYSDSDIREAIELTRDSNAITITKPFVLSHKDEISVVMMLPVYSEQDENILASRRENIVGIVVLVLHSSDLFRSVVQSIALDINIGISVEDITDNQRQILLDYIDDKGLSGVDAVRYVGEYVLRHDSLVRTGSRVWKLKFSSDESVLVGRIDKNIPITLSILGIFLSVLVGVVIFSTINLRSQAEDMASKKTKELSYRNKLFSLAAKSALIGVWSLDLGTMNIEWSDELYVMHGMDPSKKEKINSFMPLMNKEEKAKFEKDVKELLETSKSEEDTVFLSSREYSIKSKGNKRKQVYLVGQVVFDSKNKPESIAGIMQDITERYKTEKVMEEQKDEMEKMNKLMTGRELKMVELKKEIKRLESK